MFLHGGAQNPFSVYLKSFPDGESLSQFENGDTSAYFAKVAGEVTGNVMEFYPGRRLKYIIRMKDGLATDTSKWFNDDGRLENVLFCRNDTVLYGENYTYRDSTVSVKKRYYLDGAAIPLKKVLAIRVESVDITLSKTMNKPNAKYIREQYYQSGQLSDKQNFLSGKKHGEQTSYYENGNASSVKHYTNGVKDGVVESFTEDGTSIKKTCYSANKETPCKQSE